MIETSYASELIKCPHCGIVTETVIYEVVCGSEDTPLKAMLLTDGLNIFKCKKCIYEKRIDVNLKYLDYEKRYLILLCLNAEKAEDWKKIEIDFAYEQKYDVNENFLKRPVTVSSFEELKKAIHENDSIDLNKEKEEIKKLAEDDPVNFYKSVIQIDKWLKHSELLFEIDRFVLKRDVEENVMQKIKDEVNESLTGNNPESILNSFFSKLDDIQKKYTNIKEIKKERSELDLFEFENFDSNDFNFIIPAEYNKLGIELFDIFSFSKTLTPEVFSEYDIQVYFRTKLKVYDNKILNQEFDNRIQFKCSISYKHCNSFVKGFFHDSKSMEDKWIIVVEENKIYFLNSWTGELIYRAYFTDDSNEYLILNIIEFDGRRAVFNSEHELMIIDFLIKSYLQNLKAPVPLPYGLERNIHSIYNYSNHIFGEKAKYGTFENTIGLEYKLINPKTFF